MPITFSSPRAQTEVVHFLMSKAHIFVVANPKFQLQILCSPSRRTSPKDPDTSRAAASEGRRPETSRADALVVVFCGLVRVHLDGLILWSFRDMTKNVKLIGIPESNFFCIFIIASSPGGHTFFCFWRLNKKLPQVETSQNAFQRSRSIN